MSLRVLERGIAFALLCDNFQRVGKVFLVFDDSFQGGEKEVERGYDSPVQTGEREGKPLLLLQGGVDIFFAAELHQAALKLLDSGEDAEVLCAQLERLDTSALQILLALKEGLAKKGKSLQLAGVPSPVADLLGLAGLADGLLEKQT